MSAHSDDIPKMIFVPPRAVPNDPALLEKMIETCKAKVDLYFALIWQPTDSLTFEELDLLNILSNDPDVRANISL